MTVGDEVKVFGHPVLDRGWVKDSGVVVKVEPHRVQISLKSGGGAWFPHKAVRRVVSDTERTV